MDPLTLSLLLGGASSLLGGFFGNQANSNNLRAQQMRQGQIDSQAKGLMQQGPSGAENALMQLLSGAFSGDTKTGEAFNTGQDALMQMLRRPPVDTNALFQSLQPIEQRNLDQSLSDFWGTSSGLGQRFGSAAAKQTGIIRGQAAQDANARREQITFDQANQNANLKLNAANSLQQMVLQALGTQMGGYNSLIGAGQNRNALNAQLLGIMAGGGVPQQQPNQLPGSLGDISQLLLMLPFLKQLQGGIGGTTMAGRGLTPMQNNNMMAGISAWGG